MPILGSLLTSLLRAISPILERSPHNLYYAHALLELEGDKIRVTGRNSEFQLRAWQGEGVSELRAVVPARELLAILERLPKEAEVELKTEESHLVVKAGRSRYRLPALPAEDYPFLEGGEVRRALQIEAGLLAEMLDLVTYAGATDDPRPGLNGICFEFLEGSFAVTATDGARLASAELPLKSELSEEKRPILPRRAAAELRRLLKGKGGDVLISLGEGAIAFEGEGFTFSSYLIAASFPKWRELIEGYETRATIELDRKGFEAALSRVLVVLGKENRARFLPRDGLLRVEVQGELGEAVEEVPLEVVEGEPFEIHFNPRYLLEALKRIGGERARLRLTGPSEPAFLEGTEAGEVRATHLVMPVRA